MVRWTTIVAPSVDKPKSLLLVPSAKEIIFLEKYRLALVPDV